ncbi:hypothetical protein BH09BAC2_BH09BAC2_23380 [soil metagenome]
MGNRREYDIAYVGLKPGVHQFRYEIGDKFFVDYNHSDFNNCNSVVTLTLEKNTSFMMLKFEVGGNIDVVCDRCGNKLKLDLWDEFNLIVKVVENPDEMNATEEDADIYYISRTESHLHVGEWLYEFIMLSIPMQRMCKQEDIGGPQCNKEVLDMLRKMEENKVTQNNPLAKGLEQFKKNKN